MAGFALQTAPGQVEEIIGPFVDADGVSHAANVVDLWTADELAAIGVLPILDNPPVPDHSQIVVGSLSWTNTGAAYQRQYQYELIPLDDRKADMLAEVQTAKTAALAQMSYAVGDQTYVVTLSTQDQLDVQMQLQLLAAEPDGSTIRWEIERNTFLTWGVSDLQALQAAGVAHIKTAYANTDTLAAAITVAADHDALDLIDVNSGWPT